MLKNKEIKLFIIISILLLGVISLLSFMINPLAGIITLLGGILLFTLFYLFTMWRYDKITKLSISINQMARGNYALDIRDSKEGELSILKDDIYKLTTRLSEKTWQLEKEKESLAEALSDISHQLKTPLTSLSMMVDLLENNDLPEEKKKEFLENMRSSLSRMEWLVIALLKMAQLDSNTITLRKEEVNVTDLLEEALEPLKVLMEIKEIDCEFSGDEKTTVTCDPLWTAEAISNILKNSGEHTPRGGHIKISWMDNPLYTSISIVDNGEGIPKEDIPHLFKRFYMKNQSGKNNIGIGLSLSLSILKKQDGDITVKSELGVGTTFDIRLYKVTV